MDCILIEKIEKNYSLTTTKTTRNYISLIIRKEINFVKKKEQKKMQTASW